MATKKTHGGDASAAAAVPTATLDRITAELAARRRPMTLAELLAFIGE